MKLVFFNEVLIFMAQRYSYFHIDGMARRVFLSVRDAVFPLKCLACGQLFVRRPVGEGAGDFARKTALVLCERCRSDFTAIASPLCPRCGLMFVERVSDDHLCGRCLTRPGALTLARAVGSYDQSLKKIIQAFKYRNRLGAAGPLGRLLFDLYRRCYRDGAPDLIIPVPLHRKRFRTRGFNQAYLLIRNWPFPKKNAPGIPDPVIVKDGMVRRRWTEPQAGLDRKTRRLNIKGAFAVAAHLDVRGRHVLLIDDVYTTGATAEECASVLTKTGARRVDILTVARTV
jgi:ComF family protein